MKKILGLILFFCTATSVMSQKLIVLDSETLLPLKGVSISNLSKSVVVYTDKKGEVDLSQFVASEYVFIYLSQYEKEKYKVQDIAYDNLEILLDKIPESLDEVVVSVRKSKHDKNKLAEQIELLTARDIDKIAPQSSADLLAKMPSVKVQKSQFGGGSPVLRGMEANRVLLVIDGVRMNNAIYRKGHLQNGITVSPSILERIEVLYGPSSVIYGSDALGGVINYSTKNLTTAEVSEVQSSVFSRFSSANNEFTTHVDTELSFKKIASYTSISYSNFGDLRMGTKRNHGYGDWGKVFEYSNNSATIANPNSVVNPNPNVQKNTGYSQFDLLQKLFVPVSNDLEMVFNIQYSLSSNIPRFDRLTERKNDNLKFAEWSYGPQKRFMFSTQFLLTEISNWIDDGTVTFAYQNIGESRIQRKFSSIDERFYRNENVDVFSINGDFLVNLNAAKNKVLSYGFELAYNDVRSNSYGDFLKIEGGNIVGVSGNFKVQSRYPDGGSDYHTQAVYSEYRHYLTKKHTLNTGLRFTHTSLNARWIDETFITLPQKSISLSNAALTATIGDVYKPTSDTKLSFVLSSGFRSPNIDDVGKIREKAGIVTVPNISLRPEFAYNGEVGLSQYFAKKKFNIGLNLYYTLLQNYIMRAPFDIHTQQEGYSEIIYDGELLPVVANVNKGQAYITGSTFSFRGDISSVWSIRGSATLTKGKTYDTRENMSSIPPLFGNLGFIYSIRKFDFDVEYEFNAAKKVSEYNLSEGIDNIEQTPIVNPDATDLAEKYAGTPSWQIVNLSVYYQVTPDLNFIVRTNNIFDVHYKEFASAISAPGRNFSGSFKYLF